MPFSAHIHRNPDLNHVRFWGMLTLKDARRQFADAAKLPGHYAGLPILFDMRGLTGTEVNLAGLMSLRDRLIERHCADGSVLRIALLVDGDTAFGIARVFDAICSQSDLIDEAIYDSLGAALAHLGIADAELERRLTWDHIGRRA